MDPQSGLTYVIVNRKTSLVLDDPAGEGGFVNVAHLNENDTQKVRLLSTLTSSSSPMTHLTITS